MPLLHRKPFIPLKRDSAFILVLNPDQPLDTLTFPHDFDGPFRPDDRFERSDGTVEYVAGEGIPYVMKITSIDGDIVTMVDGSEMRIVSWPVSIS